MTDHQIRQIGVINQIEAQIKNNSSGISTVTPVADFENDTRICLTSVHFPSEEFKAKITELVKPIKDRFPEHYYYGSDSIHLTIKNVRVINDPPHFTQEDIKKVEKVFTQIIPNHTKFSVFFYRFLLFQNNLALIGTTDPELDNIILDLDRELTAAGIADDKKYINSRYFISNTTLIRFTRPVDREFKDLVEKLSNEVKVEPYAIDSVSLVTGNAALKRLRVINSWKLK